MINPRLWRLIQTPTKRAAILNELGLVCVQAQNRKPQTSAYKQTRLQDRGCA